MGLMGFLLTDMRLGRDQIENKNVHKSAAKLRWFRMQWFKRRVDIV